MSKLLPKRFKSRSLVFKLIAYIFLTAALGGSLAFITFISTGIESGLFERNLCFTNKCVDTFITGFSSTGLILQCTWNILAGVVTFGGIIVALLSYLASVKSSALSNHISHMSIFSTYITNEIDKRNRLSRASFDILSWYNKIYGTANIGGLDISNEYADFISTLNRLITKSNHLVSKKEDGGFRYKDHQERLKRHLLDIGITLNSLPRLDFFEVESQVFDLISTINKSFCKSDNDFILSKRLYL